MKTRLFELVELIVPANTGNRAYFQDVQQLRSQEGQRVVITGVEVFSNQASTVSPTGNAMIAIADFKKSFLTLNQKGLERIRLIPLADLNQLQGDFTTAANFVPGRYDLFQFDDITDVDWTKSYVTFGTAPAVTQFSILFGVYYRLG